jgi:excisionase family DNA binding protein
LNTAHPTQLSDYEHPFFSQPHSVEEVAEYLRVPAYFIYREIIRGKLRGLKFTPKSIRLMPGDIRDWIEQAATKPKSSTARDTKQMQEA